MDPLDKTMSAISQRERMLAGELYSPLDPELVRRQARARELAARYNATLQQERETRESLLRGLLGYCGERVWIEPPFSCDYGENIELHDGVFLNFGCVFLDCAPIRLGRGVLVGPGVQLLTATHPIDPDERARGLESARPISIGDNVWLGGGVIVLPGVTIGAGTTIGAGSVVTRDVPARVVAAGNPCRVMRAIG